MFEKRKVSLFKYCRILITHIQHLTLHAQGMAALWIWSCRFLGQARGPRAGDRGASIEDINFCPSDNWGSGYLSNRYLLPGKNITHLKCVGGGDGEDDRYFNFSVKVQFNYLVGSSTALIKCHCNYNPFVLNSSLNAWFARLFFVWVEKGIFFFCWKLHIKASCESAQFGPNLKLDWSMLSSLVSRGKLIIYLNTADMLRSVKVNFLKSKRILLVTLHR